MRFQRHHHLVNAGALQQAFQILIIAQAGNAHHLMGLLGHIAVHMEAEMGRAVDRFHILPGQMAVAHHDHVLLVVASAPVIAQHHPHHNALKADQQGADGAEHHQHQAGNVPGVDPAPGLDQVQARGDQQHAQHVDPDQHPKLLPEGLVAERAIQLSAVVGHHQQHTVQHDVRQIVQRPFFLQGKAAAGQKLPADVGGDQIRKKN